MGLIVVLVEIALLLRRRESRNQFGWLLASSCCLCVLVFPLLILGSKLDSGFSFVAANPALGDLAKFGGSFALTAQFFRYLPMAAMLILALGSHFSHSATPTTKRFLLTALVPSLILGIGLSVFVTGAANISEYIYRPYIFISCLAILVVPDSPPTLPKGNRNCVNNLALLVALVVACQLWTRAELYDKMWNQIGNVTLIQQQERIVLLKYVTDSPMFGLGLLLLIGLAVLTLRPTIRHRATVVNVFIVGAIFTTLWSYEVNFISDLERTRSATEREEGLGPETAKATGAWLRENTPSTDLAATNYLYHPDTGQPLSDYSLGAWSQREFLVLGPNLFSYQFENRRSLYEISTYFGESQDEQTAGVLRELGVRWFVVDRLNPMSSRYWERVDSVVYKNDRFLIVRL